MGKILLKYYEYIKEQKGTEGKLQLAKHTKIPSLVADAAEDNEENIKSFKETVAKITGKPAPDFK